MNQLFEVLSAEVAASLGISSRVEAARVRAGDRAL